MLQQETKLKVADNTGAKVIQCICVVGGTGRRYAHVGDTIIVSVKKPFPEVLLKREKFPMLLLFVQKRKDVEAMALISGLMKMQQY